MTTIDQLRAEYRKLDEEHELYKASIERLYDSGIQSPVSMQSLKACSVGVSEKKRALFVQIQQLEEGK